MVRDQALKRAGVEDADALLDLLAAFVSEAIDYGMNAVEGEVVLSGYQRNLASLLTRDDWRVWLAGSDAQGSWKAFLIARRLPDPQEHAIRIVDCFVHPSHRHKHLAQTLVAACKGWSRELGIRRIVLTTPLRLAAAGFWKRAGFVTEQIELISAVQKEEPSSRQE